MKSGFVDKSGWAGHSQAMAFAEAHIGQRQIDAPLWCQKHLWLREVTLLRKNKGQASSEKTPEAAALNSSVLGKRQLSELLKSQLMM